MSKWRQHNTKWRASVVVLAGVVILLAVVLFCVIRFNAARLLNMEGGAQFHYVELVKPGVQNYHSLVSVDMANDIYWAMLCRLAVPCPDPGGEGYMRVTLVGAGSGGQGPPPSATIVLRSPDCFYVESSGQTYRFLGPPPDWESIWESAEQ